MSSINPASSEQWQSGDFVLLADELAVFLARLRGEITKLPNGFWGWGEGGEDQRISSSTSKRVYSTPENNPDGWLKGLSCARYVWLEILHLASREDALRITNREIADYALGGFKTRFNASNYQIVCGSLPEYNIQPWEMERVSHGFWVKGGIPAKSGALKWWLDRNGWTASDAYLRIQLHKNGNALRRQLIRDLPGIIECDPVVDMLTLFQSVDPTITQYMGRDRKANQTAELVCPLCKQKIHRQIHQHLIRHHHLSAQDTEELLAHNPPVEGLVTSGYLAAKHGIWSQTVNKAIRDGKIPGKRIGGIWWLEETSDLVQIWLIKVKPKAKPK